jgi:uncharacterized protein YraI
MFKYKVFYKLILATTVLALVQMACSISTATATPTPSIGGVVKGVVYQDTNGNGVIDPGEGPLDGMQVSLADCGPLQSQVTAADGNFNFTNLPEGSCHVSVSKAGWHFSGSFPSLGYPIPVASNPALPTAFSIFMAPDSTAVPSFTNTPAISPTDTLTPVPASLTPTPADTATATASAAMITPSTANANCRFGPGTAFLSVGVLLVGQTVPILGTITDRTWWQIDNPSAVGTKCWVSNTVTITSGDLSHVPVLPIPTGLVTKVVITTPAVVHGTCGGPNPTWFKLSITTNGPAKVVYHLEIYNGDGTLRNKTDDTTLTFSSASTQTFDPGGAYKTDCGNFKIKGVVTSPNSKSVQATWSVVSP